MALYKCSGGAVKTEDYATKFRLVASNTRYEITPIGLKKFKTITVKGSGTVELFRTDDLGSDTYFALRPQTSGGIATANLLEKNCKHVVVDLWEPAQLTEIKFE